MNSTGTVRTVDLLIATLGVSNFHWFLSAANLPLTFFGTADWRQVLTSHNSVPCLPNVKRAHDARFGGARVQTRSVPVQCTGSLRTALTEQEKKFFRTADHRGRCAEKT